MAEYLNTSDLSDRLAELEEQQQNAAQGLDVHEDERAEPLTEEEETELAELQKMRDGITDWHYGETLIPENEFTDYAQQLAEDSGMVDQAAAWPTRHIDWQAAADELRQDFTEYTYLGETYLSH